MARRKYKETEVSSQAPVTLEFDDFKLELKGTTERIEERRRKKYGRSYGLSGLLAWEGDAWVFGDFTQEIETMFKPWRVKVDVGSSPSRYDKENQRTCWFTVAFPMYKVPKPSLIPSDEEVWAATMPFSQACRKVQLGIGRTHKVWSDQIELEDRARQATSLRNWVRDQLYDGAAETVDFAARLTALRQEVIEEVERRVAEREAEMLAGCAEADWQEAGVKFHPRAIEVGWEKGVKSALASAASVGRSGFPSRVGTNQVTPEEVE